MFNVNRHIHHHEDATVPWYRLEWRAATPLPSRAYLTHWYRAHVTGELSELPSMRVAVTPSSLTDAPDTATPVTSSTRRP